MFIAIFAGFMFLFFAGGGGSTSPITQRIAQFHTTIKHEVKDDTRRQAALDILDQMKQLGLASAKADMEMGKKLQDLAGIRSSNADLEQLLATHRVASKTDRQHLIDLLLQLRGELTRAEWSRLFPPESVLLHS